MSNFVQYTIGNTRVTRLFETSIDIPPDRLYVNWDPEDPNYVKWFSNGAEVQLKPVTLSVHTWVVESGGQVALIDTGVGNGKERTFSPAFHRLQTNYIDDLREIGISPEQVNLVLLTHLHTDHIGWNTYNDGTRWVPTFQNAKYVCPKAELEFFDTPAAANRLVIFEDSLRPILERGNFETIADVGGPFGRFTFHPTPGHSIGHMSISFEEGGARALFTGDTAHHPVQLENPELTSIFCADPGRARQSRSWVIDYGLEHNATLFTSHFSGTSAGKLKRSGNKVLWDFV